MVALRYVCMVVIKASVNCAAAAKSAFTVGSEQSAKIVVVPGYVTTCAIGSAVGCAVGRKYVLTAVDRITAKNAADAGSVHMGEASKNAMNVEGLKYANTVVSSADAMNVRGWEFANTKENDTSAESASVLVSAPTVGTKANAKVAGDREKVT